jgi:hypothetical protein
MVIFSKLTHSISSHYALFFHHYNTNYNNQKLHLFFFNDFLINLFLTFTNSFLCFSMSFLLNFCCEIQKL